MSDFLHNLRAKQNKRYDGNRRNYPNQQYQDRRNGKDNRKQQFAMASAVETLSSTLTENLPVLKTVLETIATNQDKLARVQERRAKAEERKAEALETIAQFAGQLAVSGMNLPVFETKSRVEDAEEDLERHAGTATETEPEKVTEEISADSSYDEEELEEETITRDDILNMICGLREEGMTYDQIANQLEEEAVPTFSGKGKWRGQTVHRLYQKMTS
jgi:hypothetical protein